MIYSSFNKSFTYIFYKMKSAFFTLFTLIGGFTIGQSYKITSCDTSSPVSYAHIQNTTTGKSTISNDEGKFLLETSPSDLILITHISYESITIAGNELNALCLKERTEILEEVVVEANANHRFLMEVLKKTKRKLLLPGRLNAYYKEFVQRDDEYTHFCDADVTYFIEQKKEDVKITGGLRESRAYALQVSKVDDDYIDLDLISPVGYKKTIETYNPYNIKRFLSEDAYENYDYEIFRENDEILVKAMALDEGDGVYEGQILINATDSTLLSVRFSIPEHRQANTKEVNAIVARLKLLENKGYFIYSRTGDGKIYTSFLRMTYDLKIWNKKKINQVSSFITDINVYEIPVDQSQISKSLQFNKKSIYKQGTSFQSEYWSDKSLLGLTSEEKRIIENASKWQSN